uniref:O-antigen ligase family protein n=1 Tax=uncultured Draconibacterium sp. TaxID=1573823 RepID=UPI003218024B
MYLSIANKSRQIQKLIGISRNEIFATIGGVFFLFYLFSPIRGLEQINFPNQIEITIASSLFSILILIYLIILIQPGKRRSIFLSLNYVDILLCLYGLFKVCLFSNNYTSINIEDLLQNLSLILIYLLFRIQKSPIMWLIFPITAIIQITYGIAKQTGYFAPGFGLSDISGIFSNTGIFGSYVSVGLVIVIGLSGVELQSAFKRKGLRDLGRVVLLAILLVLLIQLIKSNSRTAWLACCAGVFYLINFRHRLYQRVMRLNTVYRSVIIVSLVACIFLTTHFLYHFKKDSADGRILIWQVASEMIADKPIIGHGMNGFQRNYMEYQADFFEKNPNSSYKILADDNIYAFNEFIRILVEQGSAGLLFIISLIILLFSLNNKVDKQRSVGSEIIAKSVLLTIITFGLFSYPAEIFQFKVIVIICIAKISANYKSLHWFDLTSIYLSKSIVKKVITITLMLSVIPLTYYSYKYAESCNIWTSTLKLTNKKNYHSKIEELEKVYPVLCNHGVFLLTYGKLLHKFNMEKRAVIILSRANHFLPLGANYLVLGECYWNLGKFECAFSAWQRSSMMVPNMFTPQYNMAKMKFENGDIEEARKLADSLLKKKIKVQSPEIDFILKEMEFISKY